VGAGFEARVIKDPTTYASLTLDAKKTIRATATRRAGLSVSALTKFRFSVECDRGWNYAEGTAEGVPLEETNFKTMESKVVPGVYLIGEIFDCDGRIGGFNFQWASATGFLAGLAVSANVCADGEACR